MAPGDDAKSEEDVDKDQKVATSLAAGPSLGAALLSIWSWPVLFGVYVPLGLISFVLAERYLPHTTHVRRPFDVVSAAMVAS